VFSYRKENNLHSREKEKKKTDQKPTFTPIHDTYIEALDPMLPTRALFLTRSFVYVVVSLKVTCCLILSLANFMLFIG